MRLQSMFTRTSLRENEHNQNGVADKHAVLHHDLDATEGPSDEFDDSDLVAEFEAAVNRYRTVTSRTHAQEELRRIFRRPEGLGDSLGATASGSPTADKCIRGLPSERILPRDRIKFAADETPCSICSDRLIDGVSLTRLPCGHVFHSNCTALWLNRANTCPECRYQLETEDQAIETQRAKLMEQRHTVTCSCRGMHGCFFVDATKPLNSQPL